MTLSIVAREDNSGSFGVCGYTDIAGYGSLVPHVSLNGAVATQAYVNVDNGIHLLQLLDQNLSVKKGGEIIIARDKNKKMRQMIAIGKKNSKFCWTGSDTLDVKSSIIGRNYIVAGNCMDSFKVIEETAKYFENNSSMEFSLRLINSILAGHKAGGHIKTISYQLPKSKKIIKKKTKEIFGNSWSSALMIASTNPQIWHNLRIDADKNPIISLKKLYHDTKKSAFKLNKFYKGTIKVKPFYWRQIIK
ncbi:MAG: hypothetical protein CFH17_01075 [Alphaproteobacteria bacterium MarineAlpha5_Bin7]|nr:MAG: hypothetical protein CFH17_01075 [Alphaproteobacteria bacterium MarineAlpha5_Bin7]|tara:strand:- start:1034 stop:1774 length:741 start_codon:yes stop_codon:yes gene_type:complete